MIRFLDILNKYNTIIYIYIITYNQYIKYVCIYYVFYIQIEILYTKSFKNPKKCTTS